MPNITLSRYLRNTTLINGIDSIPEPKKTMKSSPFKVLMLIICLTGTYYMFRELNKLFNAQRDARLADKNLGKIPVTPSKADEIVDTSCKLELYCEDGESGLFDILNKYKPQPGVFELVSYQVPSSKKDRDESFVSNSSVRTADDLELAGFDRQNTYELPAMEKTVWRKVGNFLEGQREALL